MLLIESHVLNVLKSLAVNVLGFDLKIRTYDKLLESLSWHFLPVCYKFISECIIMFPIYIIYCGLPQFSIISTLKYLLLTLRESGRHSLKHIVIDWLSLSKY